MNPAPQAGYYYDYQSSAIRTQRADSAPAGLLFSKGMRSTRLLGVQIEGPGLVWNRPVAKAAGILAADEERVYLGGEELLAYSLRPKSSCGPTNCPTRPLGARPW